MTARTLQLLGADPLTACDSNGVLAIDDTGDRKDGCATDHVARQYLGSVGKIDNGIVAVTTLWANEQRYYPLPYSPALLGVGLLGLLYGRRLKVINGPNGWPAMVIPYGHAKHLSSTVCATAFDRKLVAVSMPAEKFHADARAEGLGLGSDIETLPDMSVADAFRY